MAEATAVVQQADGAVEVARALAKGATGQLRMSYLRTMFSGLPELIVSEYQRRFPGVEMTAESGTTGANVVRLRSGELDVAFVMTTIEHRRISGRWASPRNLSWSPCVDPDVPTGEVAGAVKDLIQEG
jgi:DNA-binding transcriptional LysR family regulator